MFRPSPESQQERNAARKAANLRQLTTPNRSISRGSYGGDLGGPVPKENASQNAGYMSAVRDLGYCMLCGRSCRPQFCHADEGKGERIKTDVRRGWPGCGPELGVPGCHWLVGTSGTYTKDDRRILEAGLGKKTREAVKAAGLWPAHLPMWEEA